VKIYRLYRRQKLTLSIDQAWQFFSSPYNLNDITPDFFNISLLSPVPENIYSGLMIHYAMKAVFSFPMAWLSEISHCDEPHRFVYEQRVGPFKFWSHEVFLTKEEDGVVLEDIVFYVMPLGWLGKILNDLLIAGKLDEIFNVRRDYLEARWGLLKRPVKSNIH
jgi:ligand-binding SRPBCC domain-containing protein